MAMTVADALLDRLRSWGVYRAFGYPGDGTGGAESPLGHVDEVIEVQTAGR